MMGKREAVKAILEGKGADRIPVIMNAFSLPVARYGYTMPEVMALMRRTPPKIHTPVRMASTAPTTMGQMLLE